MSFPAWAGSRFSIIRPPLVPLASPHSLNLPRVGDLILFLEEEGEAQSECERGTVSCVGPKTGPLLDGLPGPHLKGETKGHRAQDVVA